MTSKSYTESAEFGAMVSRMVRAYGRRAATDIDTFAKLVAQRAELDAAIDEAARALHAGTETQPGHSWTEIANVLGVTRQGARQRYGITA